MIRLNELVRRLQAIEAEHGDIVVCDPLGDCLMDIIFKEETPTCFAHVILSDRDKQGRGQDDVELEEIRKAEPEIMAMVEALP